MKWVGNVIIDSIWSRENEDSIEIPTATDRYDLNRQQSLNYHTKLADHGQLLCMKSATQIISSTINCYTLMNFDHVLINF